MDDDFIEDVGREAFARWSLRPGLVLRGMIADPAAEVEVVTEGNRRIGFVVVRFDQAAYDLGPWTLPLAARVEAIAVRRGFRGRGVGRALLVRAEEIAVQRGAVVMSLLTAANNRRARKLFADIGYLPLLQWQAAYVNREPAWELFKPILAGEVDR